MGHNVVLLDAQKRKKKEARSNSEGSSDDGSSIKRQVYTDISLASYFLLLFLF